MNDASRSAPRRARLGRALACALACAWLLGRLAGAAAEEAPQAEPGTTLAGELSAAFSLGPGLDDPSRAGVFPAAKIGFVTVAGPFELVGAISANRDGKYGAALADIPGGNLFGFYLLIEEGGARASLGPVSVEAGMLSFRDAVDTPYSLFVNSGGASSPTVDFKYRAGPFSYDSRWIGLNLDSKAGISDAWPGGFPDRGAAIKSFSVDLGEMRIGFQDAMVFSGRYFDFDYLALPIPMYFTQYVRGSGGVPWTTGYDDNTIMGLYWAWDRPGSFSCLAQVLLDDFGLGGLFPGWPDNPWQIAAGLGGRIPLGRGSLGLYAAMATKYCFEPSNADKSADAYGYSRYPETRFQSYWQDLGRTVTSPIAIEDNELGYMYGENNLAIRADWKGEAGGYDLGAWIEYRLSGSNSPANPGHDDERVRSTGTRWLDDTVLEHRVLSKATASRNFGPWRLFAEIEAGVAFNALELRAPTSGTSGTANDTWIYTPAPGSTKPIFGIRLGGRYSLAIVPGSRRE
jgi:hypothetical protein